MKKILLFFFLFTSLPFYSQIQAVDDYFNLPLAETIGGTTPSLNIFIQSLRSPSELGKNDGEAIFSIYGGVSPFEVVLNSDKYRNYCIYETRPNEPLYVFYHDLSPGGYLIDVIDKNGCSSSIPFNMAESPLNFTTTVLGKTMTVNATGGIPPYQYIIDDQFYANNVFSGLSVGSHTVEVRDSNMFQSFESKKIVTIEEPTTLSATATSSNIKCYGDNSGSITINATGGNLPYSYSKDGNNYNENNNFNNLTAGTYTTYVKDANNIVVSNIMTITQPETPLSSTATTIYTGIGCEKKGLITVIAEGGQAPYTYSIDGINYDSNNVFADLIPDPYTFYVKDNNGCINKQDIILYPLKDIMPPSFLVTNVSCNGGSDGSILFDTDNKDAGTYTYEINGSAPQTGNIISGLSAGTYFIGVQNSNAGCGTALKITITEPATPLSFTIAKTDISCSSKGSIAINATGGQEPYTYSIDSINYNSNNLFSDLNEGTYTVYAKDSNGCISKEEVTLYRLMPPMPFSSLVQNVSCNGGNDGMVTFDFMDTTGTYTYKINSDIPINGNTFSGLSAGVYHIIAISSNPDCYSYTTDIIITEPDSLYPTIAVENQNITVTATGGTGLYEYSLDGGQFQSSNIFNNALYGFHEIAVRDQNECVVLIYTTITPSSPLLDGKGIIAIEFKPGQTLGDLVVEGQNIKWYSSANPSTGKTSKSAETSLPLSTVLVDGVTYYASQTINGIESKERLAVTVKLNGSLSAPDFVLPNFKYYPNPVQHTLIVDNTANIDEIEILSVSGKSIVNKKINNTHSEIDLSHVASGFYFLKVKAEGQIKTIKIVKK